MEFKIGKREFLKALQWSQGIVERKTTMPILANILLETVGKKLKIAATDLETTVLVEVKAEVFKTGKVAVNARNLYDIVRELPQEEIRVEGEKNQWLELRSGQSKFRVVGMDPEEFPTLPVSKDKRFRLEPETIQKMIEKTLYAVSTNETRLTLNGVYLEGAGKEGTLRMVATDGHRLSYVDKEIKGDLKIDKGVILPRKGIVELKKLVEDGEGDLAMALEEKQVAVNRGDVSLFLRLVEGEYPDYQQVIPKKLDRILSVGREVLTGALKRSSLVSVDRARGVNFSISPGHLELTSSHPDFGEAREELPVEYKGESFQVGFNARYLLDVLAVIQDEKIVIELKDEVSPCLIRSEFDRGFLSLIMPMRI
ncbi:MAG: DNA polymerase III subunit beta [Deltaproteobacteria bacterium]|nr:DNA polymerase III subunit beta [Deltaproteobacteria bacterium]